MELSPRLRTMAELIPPGARFADIGTDHAYLPVWLLLHSRIDRAIASDLRQGPLDRARDTAEKYSVSEKMDFRLCDGLTGLQPGEADTIAIAGMGGETIARILERTPWTKEQEITLILQPMSSQSELRQWLADNGYSIEKECIAREDKNLYTVMLTKGGAMDKLTPAELLAGRQSHDPLRGEYLDHLAMKVSRILNGLRASAQVQENAIKQSVQLLEELNAMKKEWETWQL